MNVTEKYSIQKQIGKGKFGSIYLGKNVLNGEPVAIKFQNNSQSISSSSADIQLKTLCHETTIINYLYARGCRNIPKIYWYGRWTKIDDKNTCSQLNPLGLIMPFYKYSIYDIVKTSNRFCFPSNIMTKFIAIIENIHKNYVIHRDIKPQNFMFDPETNDIILIDFGCATFYVNELEEHIENSQNNSLIGTPKYMSINLHYGNKYSRRDDLISLGYMFIFMIYGSLFWEKSTYTDAIKLKQIENIQQNISDKKIVQYLTMCYNLEYTETPNYTQLQSIFQEYHIQNTG